MEEIARTKLSFKLINNPDYELSKSNFHVENYLDAREAHFRVLVRQFLYLVGFKVLIAAGLLITGSFLVFNQQMNIGQFVAAEIIIILIIASVEKLITSLDSIYDVLTALEKIGYVTDMPLDKKEGLLLGDEHTSFSVEVDHLSYRHNDATKNTINSLSFSVPNGKSALIGGPSGAGKSTLMQLISGILDPSEGLVKINGLPMKSLNDGELRKSIGYSLSNNSIFQGTIIENIRMGRSEVNAEEISSALKKVNLSEYISSVPMGLNTILDPEGKRIPRSVENKILLARAIVNNPKLLILEDPLDHVAQDEKKEIIQSILADQDWTVVVSAVDDTWAAYVDRKINIEQGELKSINTK